MEAVKSFEKMTFQREEIADHAEKFSEERFRKELKDYILEEYRKFEERRDNPFYEEPEGF